MLHCTWFMFYMSEVSNRLEGSLCGSGLDFLPFQFSIRKILTRGVSGWVQCTAHYYWCHMVPGLPLTFELNSPNNEQNVAKSSHFSSNFAEKVAALLFVAWLVINIPNYVRPRGIRYKPWNLNYIDIFQSQSYHLLHHGSSVKEGMHPLAASLNASAW